jgi:ATP-dependent Clp protease ATP-binding subunit ClpX
MLKQHLDEFVVGQETAKKVLSTAIYNHYQRIQELQRQEDEYEELMAQRARREMASKHPVEGTSPPAANGFSKEPPKSDREPILILDSVSDEYPGQQSISFRQSSPQRNDLPSSPFSSLDEQPALLLEKSNVLLLGPTGVGKTLMVKTLARILDVPFSMSDCTPLTQAGYIGEDVEIVVQRLLVAANYDVARAESGIICLDEIDKIASAKVSHGKDVGGEGVQQALLKIIEGTSVTVHAKAEKVSPVTARERERSSGPPPAGFPHQAPMGGVGHGNSPPTAQKNETFTVRTDNILFICTGAFIGLHKFILERMGKGSIGFNAPVRSSLLDPNRGVHETTIKIDSSNAELFKEHLKYRNISPSATSPYSHSTNPTFTHSAAEDETVLNTLDLLTPADLQKYGLIPELVGRVPIHCALSPLSEESLVRVLTEPKNALLKQFEVRFSLSGIELRFTTGAIREVAKRAAGLGTGARGLLGVLEGVLRESMFEAPGSSTKYVLVTSDVIKGNSAPVHLSRGQGQLFNSIFTKEEDEHRRLHGEEIGSQQSSENFQDHGKKVSAAGS